MAKDPAALFYIDKWLVATKEMRAECRGWFLNLILHQFDKGDLPSDLEELANLADVRISEFNLFKQTFEQVLKHKFKQKANGRLENANAAEIMQGREAFKEKREVAGKMSYLVRYIRKHLTADENLIFFIKKNVDVSIIDTTNEQMIKQVFKQMSELYINVNKNVNVNNNINNEGGVGETESVPTSVEVDTPRFLVGNEPVNDIKKYLEAHFQILMNDLKKNYGELKFEAGIKVFEKMNLQKQWKDSQDLRQHFTNFLIKHEEFNRSEKNRTLGDFKRNTSTLVTNEGKEMGAL